MTIRFEKFYPEHLQAVNIQRVQREEAPLIMSPEVVKAAAQYLAFSGWDGEKCLGCAGVVPLWQNRAVAWAFLSADVGRYLVPITRFVRAMLDSHPANRIECTVLPTFDAGNRWALMLGFERETEKCMRAYDPDGRDMALYARVRG